MTNPHPEVVGNDRYTPQLRRKGKVYCSPWCGIGCTRAAFERATREANELCALLGDGWRPRVWENLGWFYAAERGPDVGSAQRAFCEVHPSTRGSTITADWTVAGYTIFLNVQPKVVLSDVVDPVDGVHVAIHQARTHVQRTNALLEELSG